MRTSISILALLLPAVASSCSSSSTAKSGDAATTKDVGQANDVGQTHDVALDVSADAVVPPANVMFPEAPDVSCGDAGDCPLPPSACADPSCDGGGACYGFRWVVYYDNPACVNGQCVYTNRYFECSLDTTCTAGGCRFNGTLGAP
jgi:hypothetical protein